jgi:hypothetical protein
MSAAASTASNQSGTPKNGQPDDGSSVGQADDVPVLPAAVGVASGRVAVGVWSGAQSQRQEERNCQTNGYG